MGNFDGTVRKIITDINAERDKRKSEAESNAMTAETIFGGIGQLIQELQPELAKVLPDLAPEVSLGAWVRRDGVLENTLSFNRVGNHKHIPLLAESVAVKLRWAKTRSVARTPTAQSFKKLCDFFRRVSYLDKPARRFPPRGPAPTRPPATGGLAMDMRARGLKVRPAITFPIATTCMLTECDARARAPIIFMDDHAS